MQLDSNSTLWFLTESRYRLHNPQIYQNEKIRYEYLLIEFVDFQSVSIFPNVKTDASYCDVVSITL